MSQAELLILSRCGSKGSLQAAGTLHTDAVQAVNWLDVAVAAVRADMMSLSGHKFGAPKGSAFWRYVSKWGLLRSCLEADKKPNDEVELTTPRG